MDAQIISHTASDHRLGSANCPEFVNVSRKLLFELCIHLGAPGFTDRLTLGPFKQRQLVETGRSEQHTSTVWTVDMICNGWPWTHMGSSILESLGVCLKQFVKFPPNFTIKITIDHQIIIFLIIHCFMFFSSLSLLWSSSIFIAISPDHHWSSFSSWKNGHGCFLFIIIFLIDHHCFMIIIIFLIIGAQKIPTSNPAPDPTVPWALVSPPVDPESRDNSGDESRDERRLGFQILRFNKLPMDIGYQWI